MKKIKDSIPYKNIINRPGKSVLLILLSMILCALVLVFAITLSSLSRGMNSLNERLGADIMVVPYEAATRSDLKNIVLQGNMGYFYMDSSVVDKISAMEGVAQISPQIYLASASSGCCSIPVQIIGYDPETDFTITPWIRKSNGSSLNYMEVVVGNDLNAFVGDVLTFYGMDVKVAAKLDKTGTNLDTAVYTSNETIKALIASSIKKKMNAFKNIDPDKVVSCVLVNVAEGYVVEDVLNDINLHVRKTEAVQTRNMISSIASALNGAGSIMGGFSLIIWILSTLIAAIMFSMSINSRKKEFAMLRALGATSSRVVNIAAQEGLMLTVCGSVIGIALGVPITMLMGHIIENALGLPFLMPGAANIIITGLLAILITALTGVLVCRNSAQNICRMETGDILREE